MCCCISFQKSKSWKAKHHKKKKKKIFQFRKSLNEEKFLEIKLNYESHFLSFAVFHRDINRRDWAKLYLIEELEAKSLCRKCSKRKKTSISLLKSSRECSRWGWQHRRRNERKKNKQQSHVIYDDVVFKLCLSTLIGNLLLMEFFFLFISFTNSNFFAAAVTCCVWRFATSFKALTQVLSEIVTTT